MNKRDFKGFMNLKYVVIKNVPVSEDKEFGGLIQASVMKKMERKVAISILNRCIPITGIEVEFFRSILGLPQREFAKLFDLSQVAILKWEREKSKRLSFPNEIAFRVVMANRIGINLRINGIINGPEKAPVPFVVDFSSDPEKLAKAA